MTGNSSCPDCGTILRIRDRTFVGRRVSCPECKTPLKIESFDDDAGFAIRKLQPAELKHVSRRRKNQVEISSSAKPPQATFVTWLSRTLSSPLTAACLLLAGMVAFFAVLMFNPKLRIFTVRTTPVQVIPEGVPIEVETPPEPIPLVTPAPVEPAFAELTVSSFIDDSESLSALEPANLDQPILWPPVPSGSEPVIPPTATPPKPLAIDVVGKMAQKLVSYKQPKISRRHLIEALSEYLGAPIFYDADELGTVQLEEQVSFELKNTTVGDIIKAVADEAGWQIKVEPTGLRLIQKTPAIDP